MMTTDPLNDAIYKKYILPTKRARERAIGIEIEMPVVSLDGDAVNEKNVQAMAGDFISHFGFEVCSRDDNGDVNSASSKATGDNLSFDCSYSNLELSMGKCGSLFEVMERFSHYYRYINEKLSEYNYTLTGMGINPALNINHNKPVPNERYRMLYHYLHSYKKYEGGTEHAFHNRPDFGTFTSASQVQIDVGFDELTEVINTFGLLEPYKAFLFANSYLPERPELLCSRNMLWEHSMQGYNPHNIGMFEHKLSSADEIVEYIRTQSIYCTMRNGRYIDFTPVPVEQYFSLDKISGEYFDGVSYQRTEFVPEPRDLEYLRTFKFEDLTFRGTIEFRSSCCQPIKDSMTVAALHIGLIGRLHELTDLLERDRVLYTHGYSATELQRLMSLREIPAFVDKDGLREQLKRILDIAGSGLADRGLGEEEFLSPLYERAETLKSPAAVMVEGIESGRSINDYIREYASL